MLKFTMNAKELKTMIDKGVTAVNRKATLPNLTKLYFQVESDGVVKIWGTDLDHYAEVRSNNAWNIIPGILGIDVEDLKIITKMNDDITLEDISSESDNKISVKSGKKFVTIPKYENVDTFLPTMDSTEEYILSLNESWLLETLTNLFTYTSDNKGNKMMQVFNFNTIRNRVEALDTHRVGMRTLGNQKIQKKNTNVLLHRKCLTVFKKIMNKKSDAKVEMFQDDKYIRIEGKEFTYIIRRIEGEFFNLDRILTGDVDYSFTVDKEEIFSVMKYNCDLVKDLKRPVVLHSKNGILHTYLKTIKYETFDTIETVDNKMDGNLYLGFDPFFLTDVFRVVDKDKVFCHGKGDKSPLFVDGNEYSFLVMPTNIGDEMENIKKCMNRDRVA